MPTVTAETLLQVYLAALERCAPEKLVCEALERSGAIDVEHDVVAIGKCAGRLLDGASAAMRINSALAALPEGYPRPSGPGAVVEGSHPEMTAASFEAGGSLEDFVRRASRPVLFLISGGGSACAEQALEPWFNRDDLAHVNATLIRAGLPIEKINTVRKHLSAIKGGRLGALAPGSTTLIYSDVAAGQEQEVASGPTVPDPTTNENAAVILQTLNDRRCEAMARVLRDGDVPETTKTLPRSVAHLIADNRTLVKGAAEGCGGVIIDDECNDDVENVAGALHRHLQQAPPGTILVAGGEPTVAVVGAGRGGRCSELAVRFARECARKPIGDVHALFGSSDGLDGNSGVAGVVMSWAGGSAFDESEFQRAVAASDTLALAGRIGRPIRVPRTGNNLRDIFMMARY